MYKRQVINGEDLPAEWKEAQSTSIFKKGNKKDCENYRGKSVIATMGRPVSYTHLDVYKRQI